MRQAGRYLPEYRATREQAGGFLDLCYNSELAEEVTLQPIRRYDFDAAILFASAFYDAIGNGRDIPFAFRFARNSLDLEDMPESALPIMIEG